VRPKSKNDTDGNVGKADVTVSEQCLAHQTVSIRLCLRRPISDVSYSFEMIEVTSLLL